MEITVVFSHGGYWGYGGYGLVNGLVVEVEVRDRG